MFQINPAKPRLAFQKWARQYGGAYRIRTITTGEVVVVSRYDTIHEVRTVNGAAFSDRPDFFWPKYAIGNILGARNNGASWRKLRKLSHRYLKQFGDGMSKLKDIQHEVVDGMVVDLGATNSFPVNIMETLKEASFHSISVLLLGRVVDRHNPLLKMLTKYAKTAIRCVSPVSLDQNFDQPRGKP